MTPLKSTIAERLHPYFTAVDGFADDPVSAFNIAKQNMAYTLKSHIEIIERMELDEFCRLTGSGINK